MARNSSIANLAAFLSSIKDDIANITSPPSFLAPTSTTEISACWAERPTLFVAPTLETSPERRCLAVLKWIVASHRRQFYISEHVSTGIKKPLNSFLGEVFKAQWTDDLATTSIVTEQVSYQPSVTACYISSDAHRVWGNGFSRIEMSFNGALAVRQTGFAMLHLDQHNEHYLIQLPNIEVKGFLAGHLYPELYGTYHIVSSSGIMAQVSYSGKGFMSGSKNEVQAKVFRKEDKTQQALYTLAGCWSDRFSIYEQHRGELIEEWSHTQNPPAKMRSNSAVNRQDQWEAGRAWHDVKVALTSGDLPRAVAAKLRIENAQRALRAVNPQYASHWEPLFFTASWERHALLEALASAIGDWDLDITKTGGLWCYDTVKAAGVNTPYHRGEDPAGSSHTITEEGVTSYFIYDVDEGTFKPMNTVCESSLPQQQRDYLRQRRLRRQEIRG